MANTNDNKPAAPHTAGHDNGEDSISDLLSETIETSIKTSINMMKVPVVIYAGMVDCWAKAVESMLRDLRPGADDSDSN